MQFHNSNQIFPSTPCWQWTFPTISVGKRHGGIIAGQPYVTPRHWASGRHPSNGRHGFVSPSKGSAGTQRSRPATKQKLHSLKLTVCPKKWWFPIGISFSKGLFFRGYVSFRECRWIERCLADSSVLRNGIKATLCKPYFALFFADV